MDFKSIVTSLIFIAATLNGFSQIEPKSQINKKNFIGIEFSMMGIAIHNACTQNGLYVNEGTSYSNSLKIVSIEYMRKFKNLDLFVLGNYLYTYRQLNSSYTSFENKQINYKYQGYLQNSQYTLLFMPHFNILDQCIFYLKPGIGINFNVIKQIRNSNVIITGLDGKFKRVKPLPNLNQSKLSLRLALDLGTKSEFYNKNIILLSGMRLSINSYFQLKKENIYTSSRLIELYFSILFAIK